METLEPTIQGFSGDGSKSPTPASDVEIGGHLPAYEDSQAGWSKKVRPYNHLYIEVAMWL